MEMCYIRAMVHFSWHKSNILPCTSANLMLSPKKGSWTDYFKNLNDLSKSAQPCIVMNLSITAMNIFAMVAKPFGFSVQLFLNSNLGFLSAKFCQLTKLVLLYGSTTSGISNSEVLAAMFLSRGKKYITFFRNCQ